MLLRAPARAAIDTSAGRVDGGTCPRYDIEAFERNFFASVFADAVQFGCTRHAIKCLVDLHQLGRLARGDAGIDFFIVGIGAKIGWMCWVFRYVAVPILHLIARFSRSELGQIALYPGAFFVQSFLEMLELFLAEWHMRVRKRWAELVTMVPRALHQVPALCLYHV